MMIEDLIEAARQEDWVLIDGVLPSVCDKPEIVNWASVQGLKDSDGNVRDLAVSILEKTKVIPEEGGVADKLHELMGSDDNPYVRYRSAFALAAHKPVAYGEEVRGVLQEALQDSATADIAKGYLAEF